MKRLLALIEAPDHVCYRYRIRAFREALARRGWQLESLPLTSHTLWRPAQLRTALRYDAVVLQRRLLPLWQLRLLRRWSSRLIYDFDDALFHRDSYSSKGPTSLGRLAHFWATIYTADTVIAGNSYLHEQAASYIDPVKVHRVPTCVEPAAYPLAEHVRQGRDVRLVWIGQHSTLPCLAHAQPALARIADRLPGLELRVICDQFPSVAGLRVVPRIWSSATEAADVAAGDIGISYLPDDPWSQGKCGLKVLQYMAAGLPVVANPVGANREMIVDGQTGLLASTPEEWEHAVVRLAADPALRARFGAAGRKRVEQHYSVARWSARFAAVVANRIEVPRPFETRRTFLPSLPQASHVAPSLEVPH